MAAGRRPILRPTDKRYRTTKWKRTRLRVLNRDGWTCWVPGCYRYANVADHIDPVQPWTTDAAFYDVSRLRASCRGHNIARGFADGLERDLGGQAPATPRRTIFGRTR